MDVPVLLVELESALVLDTELMVPIAMDTASIVPIALSELLHAQQHDGEVLNALMKGRLHGHAVYENKDGLIVRKVKRVELPPLKQALVLAALRDRVLKMAHQPQENSHPGVPRMFWTMRTQF